MLPRAHRLRRSADFSDIVRHGLRAGTSTLVAYRAASIATLESPARVGFVVGRNVGTAVIRNQVKRRLRHLMADRLPFDGTPIVVRANPAAAGASFVELARDLDSCLARLARRRESVLAR